MKIFSDLQLPINPPEQSLEGVIENLTYYNEETGYTVARIRENNSSKKVTVVGILTGVNTGESVKLKGTWTKHPRFGRQFEIESFSVQLPSTLEGIEKYLGSGMIRGIGPVTAKRIVDYFGEKTLDIISNEPDRLIE
ncbi:MAG: hypothetical protein MUO76_07250, partial [Anaerolineaceae bacterium]|nr:hypothetical protein [Anaerolineaceae bacterium]